jgi:hypothetical protein
VLQVVEARQKDYSRPLRKEDRAALRMILDEALMVGGDSLNQQRVKEQLRAVAVFVGVVIFGMVSLHVNNIVSMLYLMVEALIICVRASNMCCQSCGHPWKKCLENLKSKTRFKT